MRTYDSKRWYVNLGLTILTAKPKGKCIHFSHYFIFQLTTSFAFPLPKELPFEEINEKENVNFYRGVHGKKLAFTVRKTKIEFKENGAFYKRLPTFCVENPTFSVRFRTGESQYLFHYTVVFLRGKCR